jgi:hypothetical protein
MITSLVKVDSGLSHGSIPRAPTLWGGKRAVLWLHLFGFDGFGAASNAASRRQVGCLTPQVLLKVFTQNYTSEPIITCG